MRIFVVEPDGAGGMVHYAYQLCGALSAEGADVTLITGKHYELAHLPHTFAVDTRISLWPAVGESDPESRLARLVVRGFRKVRRVWRGFRYAFVWARLTRHLLAERPDVVQFAIIRFPFQSLFLRRLRRAGIALTQICHEFEPRERTGFAQRLTRLSTRSVYHSFDRIYLHGEQLRSEFLEAFDVEPAAVSTISHGNEAMFLELVSDNAPPAIAASTPQDRPVALFFGGLRPSKGIEDLIEAWAHVVAEVDAHLLICGQPAGVDPAALRARADALAIGDHVTLDPGYLPLSAVSGLFNLADIVVLPYRSATASGVLQLAYAFGRPVVATDLGALSEDVDHGQTGLLVPPDNQQELGRAMIKLLSDRAEIERMGTMARSASDRYGWGPIARTILEDARELTA